MGKLFGRLEKLLTGYTADERADITRRYIDWRIEQVIVGSLERLTAEDEAAAAQTPPADDEVQP